MTQEEARIYPSEGVLTAKHCLCLAALDQICAVRGTMKVQAATRATDMQGDMSMEDRKISNELPVTS